MKKIIWIVSCMLVLSFFGSVQAAENEGETTTYKSMGITVTWPSSFKDTKGVVMPYEIGDLGNNTAFCMPVYYFGVPQDELNDYLSGSSDVSDSQRERISRATGFLGVIFAAEDSLAFEDLNGLVTLELDAQYESELAKTDGFTFYLYEDPQQEWLEELDPDYAIEFEELRFGMEDALAAADYDLPDIPGKDMIGKTVQFETTDTDGNVVKSEELFAEHEITMVNIWASWCGPCQNELSGLSEMNERLTEKDCAVVGILADGNTESGLSDGKAVMEQYGVSYPVLLPPENLTEILSYSAYPTSYFVDRSGTIVTYPIQGAPADLSEGNLYEQTIWTLLAGGETEEPQESGDDAYVVNVTDTDGSPVQDVYIQFCSDDSCTLGTTDENGTAVFEAEPGIYTIHILTVPEGYAENTEEYETTESYGQIDVTLEPLG